MKHLLIAALTAMGVAAWTAQPAYAQDGRGRGWEERGGWQGRGGPQGRGERGGDQDRGRARQSQQQAQGQDRQQPQAQRNDRNEGGAWAQRNGERRAPPALAGGPSAQNGANRRQEWSDRARAEARDRQTFRSLDARNRDRDGTRANERAFNDRNGRAWSDRGDSGRNEAWRREDNTRQSGRREDRARPNDNRRWAGDDHRWDNGRRDDGRRDDRDWNRDGRRWTGDDRRWDDNRRWSNDQRGDNDRRWDSGRRFAGGDWRHYDGARGWDRRWSDWRRIPHGGFFNRDYAYRLSNYWGGSYYWWSYPNWRRPYRRYTVGYILPSFLYWEPVPYEIYGYLPPPPYGCDYVMVDRDVLLISLTSMLVIDALILSSY
ncbi:MAG: hypothetical protein AB7L65_08660 [Hyphomonadaceae bacterium]